MQKCDKSAGFMTMISSPFVSSSPSFLSPKHVLTFKVASPRAVAIVLGPLGSTHKLMKEIASFYHHRNCSVVVARSPPFRFFLAQHGALSNIASCILNEAASMIREAENDDSEERFQGKSQSAFGNVRSAMTTNTETSIESRTTSRPPEKKKIPVIVHMYSNGGTFMVEEMDRQISLLEEAAEPNYVRKENCMSNTMIPAQLIVADRIRRYGYLFYDSCPCFLHMVWDIRPEYWKTAFPFPMWDRLSCSGVAVGDVFRKAYLFVAATSLSVWCLLTGSSGRSKKFWSCMLKPPINARHLVYMYSTNDKVTDSSRIDDLIAEQRLRQRQQQRSFHDDDNDSGTNSPSVVAYKYDDADHVDISAVHPEDYNKAIDEALRQAIHRTYNDKRM